MTIGLQQYFSSFNVYMSHLGILLKCDSDLGSLKQGLKFCISNKFPGDVDAAGPRTPIWVAQA